MTTTSIPGLLVLGLLAERPWTAYDLVKYLTRPSMASAFWDVSERTWYREPARLVDAGLAETLEGGDGSPTTYRITEAGRRALAEAAPDENRVVYRNQILAILYAVAGGPIDEIDSRLEQLRSDLVRMGEALSLAMRELAEAGPTLPQRSHVSALLARVYADTVMGVYDWAGDAQRRLQELGPSGDRARFARETWCAIADDLDRFVERHRADSAHQV